MLLRPSLFALFVCLNGLTASANDRYFEELLAKLCGEPDLQHCDALPTEAFDECSDGCDAMAAEHQGCIDRWLPRSDVCLPIGKSLVEGRDVQLPLPLGVSFVSTTMRRNVAVDQIRLGLGSTAPQPVERASVADFTANAYSQLARFDAWLLPCFSTYAVVGHTRSEGQLLAKVERFPFPMSPPIDIPVRFGLDGLTYGGGGTLAVGSKRWFASVDANYTHTDFDALASELFALVIAPRVGIILDRPCYKGEIHFGAMWQDTGQTVDVVVNTQSLGPVRVEVDQFEPRPWNFLVGTLWGVSERLHLMVELGTGGREYVIASTTLRF